MNLSPEIALCAPPGDCVAGIPSSASSEERAAATLVLEKLVEAFRQGTGNPGKPGRETRDSIRRPQFLESNRSPLRAGPPSAVGLATIADAEDLDGLTSRWKRTR